MVVDICGSSCSLYHHHNTSLATASKCIIASRLRLTVGAQFCCTQSSFLFIPPNLVGTPFARFISYALTRDPTARPTAAQLLQHDWIRMHTSVTNDHRNSTQDSWVSSIQGSSESSVTRKSVGEQDLNDGKSDRVSSGQSEHCISDIDGGQSASRQQYKSVKVDLSGSARRSKRSCNGQYVGETLLLEEDYAKLAIIEPSESTSPEHPGAIFDDDQPGEDTSQGFISAFRRSRKKSRLTGCVGEIDSVGSVRMLETEWDWKPCGTDQTYPSVQPGSSMGQKAAAVCRRQKPLPLFKRGNWIRRFRREWNMHFS